MSPEAQDTIALILPPANVDPHGSLRLSTWTYGAAFEETGCRTITLDLDALTPEGIETLRSSRIRAIFSDGGWINAVQARTGGGMVPLVDVLDKPVLILINDSPCAYWMPQVIAQDRPNQTTAFIDADFSAVWSRWVPKLGRHQCYVPACPAGAGGAGAGGAGGAGAGERTIDTLAVVSLRPPDGYRDFIRQNIPQPVVHRLFDGIVELGLYDNLRPFSAICDDVCRSLGVCIDYGSATQRLVLYSADGFIRNRRRQIMLDRLAGHPITLVGGGDGVRLHPDTRVLPAMPHADVLNLYRQARNVVVSPPYSGGITERTIQPMAAGALVVSPPGGLSDELLGRDRLFVTIRADFADLDEGLDRARDPALRRPMVEAALDEIPRRFSPTATVRRFFMPEDATL
jgi:hypothetical protein